MSLNWFIQNGFMRKQHIQMLLSTQILSKATIEVEFHFESWYLFDNVKVVRTYGSVIYDPEIDDQNSMDKKRFIIPAKLHKKWLITISAMV